MTEDEKQKVREAFLAAAESPAADKCLEGTDIHIATLFRRYAEDKDGKQLKALEYDIAEHRTTVDRFVAALRKNFPPAP